MGRRKKSKNKVGNNEVETESQRPDNNNTTTSNTGGDDDEDVMEMVMSEKVNAMQGGKSRDFDQTFCVPTTERRDTDTMDGQESVPQLMIDNDRSHNNDDDNSIQRTSLVRNTTPVESTPGAFQVRTFNYTNSRNAATTDDNDGQHDSVVTRTDGNDDQGDGVVIVPEASLVRTTTRQDDQNEDLENPSSSSATLNPKEVQVMIAEVVVSEAKASNIDDENEVDQKQQLKLRRRRRRRIFGCVILCLLLLIAAVLIALLVQGNNERNKAMVTEDSVDDVDDDLPPPSTQQQQQYQPPLQSPTSDEDY
jgi:hypothetical protein